MTYKITALSLGAGVQSSTILLMACRGELPKPDLAIFADTGWESEATYRHLGWLEKEAQEAGIPLIRVNNGNLRENTLSGDRPLGAGKAGFIDMPLHVKDRVGNRSMLKRQCTRWYKLSPISKELRRLLGVKPRQRIPTGAIELWIGISTDEVSRANISRDKLITNSYPLLTIKPMSRVQCQLWLEQSYDGLVAPKSSCVGCPFHRDYDWQQIKASPAEWQMAVEVDKSVRRDGDYSCFLHKSCNPLDEVDLRTPQEKGQLEFDLGKVERLQLFGNLEI